MTQTRGGLCGGGSWNFKCTCSGSPQERARDTDSTRVTKKTQLLGALAGSAIVSRPRVLFDSATAFFFRSSRAFGTLPVRRSITHSNGNRVPETQRSRFVAGRPGPPPIAPCTTTAAAATTRSCCGDGTRLSACRLGLFLPSLSRLDVGPSAEAARARQTLAAVVGPRRESGGRGRGGGGGAGNESGDGDGRVVARRGGVQAAGNGGRGRRAQGRRT